MPTGVYKRSQSIRDNLRFKMLGTKRHLGFRHSKETREKMRLAKLGKTPWNKGIKNYISDETRKKMSVAKLGVFKGNKSPLWRGGITPENIKIRNSIEYRLWREAVFARDNWTCQRCGQRGQKIHPHHVRNFAQFFDIRLAIDNGITLCENCHRAFHRKYGKKNNTKEQLIEFFKHQ